MEPVEIAILSTALLVFACVSARAQTGAVSPPMAFAALGLIIGADGLRLVELSTDSEFILKLAEITLALTLFIDASRIDVTALDRRHAIPIRLLAIGLPLTMLAGTGAAWLLFPALGLWGAAVLAVALAPTDAALGQAVMSNRAVPLRVRQALNVESGLNDGLAFPALLVVATLAAGAEGRGAQGWAAFIAAQLLLGPLVGAAVGWLAARASEQATARGWMDETYLRLAALAVPLLAYGLAETVDGNGFLAAFSCGLMVAARGGRLRGAAGAFGEAEGQLLALAVFVLFGAVLLPDLAGLSWRHGVFAALALTVLRMGPVALALLGTGLRPATVAFLGWFGPRGMASVIYLLLVLEEYTIFPGLDDLRLTVLVTVAASILLHGISAAPLARLYGRMVKRPEGGASEHDLVPTFALRHDPRRDRHGRRGERG
ncbi:cation:proton antiporter [uncultured Jannaschia sp.]|uniref:cation:proton antiporter n=1 Tax=uncultured Jannaschia sp. TaxID=293347 RepID=UPI00261D61D3|nr:cation:proton antiporter [uncultured Jannaschia sp.]